MPERFDLTYTGADNQEHRPVMIHRAAFGSYERFIGIMLEHYGGELPLWLAPVQAIVLPISDPFNEYGATRQGFATGGPALRVELDARGESIGKEDPRGRAAQDPADVDRRRARDAGWRRSRCESTGRVTPAALIAELTEALLRESAAGAGDELVKERAALYSAPLKTTANSKRPRLNSSLTHR